MIPIHALLARIRWDPRFGRGRFELAYLDRKAKRLVRVPFERLAFDPQDRFGFTLVDEEEGRTRSIPYHRVRAVWRDGVLIWSRRPRAAA